MAQWINNLGPAGNDENCVELKNWGNDYKLNDNDCD